MAAVVDQTRGIYRRIYAGFLTGQRINSVSLEAEAWFWRLQAMADDFGTFSADPRLLHLQAAPRRSIDPEVAEGLLQDLARAGLVRLYSVEGYRYGSIVGFEQIQPAPKNGRRLRKYPAEPPMGNPGESGGIRIIPGESTTPHSHTHSHTHIQPQAQTQTHRSEAKPPTAAVCVSSPGFDAFWTAWPQHHRKANKTACRKKWEASGCEAERLRILAAVDAWKASADWNRDGGRYVPAPLVWLNKRAWEAPHPARAGPGDKRHATTVDEIIANSFGDSDGPDDTSGDGSGSAVLGFPVPALENNTRTHHGMG